MNVQPPAPAAGGFFLRAALEISRHKRDANARRVCGAATGAMWTRRFLQRMAGRSALSSRQSRATLPVQARGVSAFEKQTLTS